MDVIEIRERKAQVCVEILRLLPQWFGIPDSNAAYERDVERLPMFGAVENGALAGLRALKQHTPTACEIHVRTVRPAQHRGGAGRALVEAAASYAGAAQSAGLNLPLASGLARSGA